MLYLNNQTPQEVIVNLYALSSNITNPYFTWKIVNKDTEEETIFYQDDHSNSPYDYNSFTLSVATYSGLTAGVIDVPMGQYEYFIYETNTQYDLIITTASNLVKTGILQVTGTSSEIASFTQSLVDTIPTFLGGI